MSRRRLTLLSSGSASAGFSGLSRLWYRTELLHHAEHVHLDPALRDLALDHPVYGMTYELDPLAGRGYSSNSPKCVPRNTNRLATFSPSAICSTLVPA